jgi:predicted nucleic acid-binding protein
LNAPVYLDSSVIVSYLVAKDEKHSRTKTWLDSVELPFATSVLAQVEVGRALSRLTDSKRIPDASRWMDYRVHTIDISDEIRRIAIDVRPGVLRSLDAIHVSTAIWAQAMEFATLDGRQSLAAEEMGLRLAKL